MRYEKYVKADVWISVIPQHWKQLPVKRVFLNIGSGTTPLSSRDKYYGGDIAWIQSGDLHNHYINSTKKCITEDAVNSISALKIFSFPFISIAMYGASIGNLSISQIDACTNQACCNLSACNENIEFMYYALSAAQNYIISLSAGGTQPNIKQEIVKNILLPVPPRAEQDQIVRYLDWQVSKINKLITAKKKQIESVHECVLGDLYRVMTNGLFQKCRIIHANNRWIESIPEHWKIVAIRRNYSSVLGKMLASSPKNITDTLEYYFCAKDVHFNTADKRDLKKMWFSLQEKESYLVINGDLLIVEGGAGAGGAAIAKITDDEHIYIQNSIHLVRPKTRNASNMFLCYWLYCLQNRGYIDYACNVATIPHFTKEKLLITEMPFPPYAEQLMIVDYLDRKFREVEVSENSFRKEIDTLYELRTRLISDVVTGQMDVRNIEVPDFEMVEEIDTDDALDEDESSEGAEEQEEG